MKITTLLIVILMSASIFAQKEKNPSTNIDQFIFNQKGLNPKSISVEIKGLKKEDLADKIEAWSEFKFGKTKGKTEKKATGESETAKGKKGKKVKVKGFTYNAICADVDNKRNCENVDYTIDIEIEDGKYIFKPSKLSYNGNTNKKGNEIDLSKSEFHESQEKLKTEYSKVPSQIEDLFNTINKSLYNFINDLEQEDEM